MEFIVPQFIDRKPKIVGPFNFTQLLFLAVAAGICITLWFLVPFAVFVVLGIIIFGAGLALAIGKVEKIPLPTIIKNLFLFLFKPKIYLWRRKEGVAPARAPAVAAAEEAEENQRFEMARPEALPGVKKFEEPKKEEAPKPKTTAKSKLTELFNHLEIK